MTGTTLAIIGLCTAISWLLAVRCDLRDKVAKLKQDNEEYERLFELQGKRLGEATKAWREETGEHLTSPDLGDLLGWLLRRRQGTYEPRGGSCVCRGRCDACGGYRRLTGMD